MSGIINVILLMIGFVLLIKGADVFVDSSSILARKIGIPSVIVGLTIISLGTSAPELAVSTISALNGNNGIAVGNVIGSNMFNTLVVLGATAIAMPLIIKKREIKRDFLVNIGVVVFLYLLIFGMSINNHDGSISRLNGITLLILCAIYIFVLISNAMKNKGVSNENAKELQNVKFLGHILKIIVGVISIVVGGDVVVNSASSIATSLGMSDKLVGLTIVAIGTSLPELTTSIVAALKGETEIAIGNVLGSNIFNILLILGVSSSICPIPISAGLSIDILVLIIVSLFIGILIYWKKGEKIKKLSRWEGLFLVGIYIIYLVYIIMRN